MTDIDSNCNLFQPDIIINIDQLFYIIMRFNVNIQLKLYHMIIVLLFFSLVGLGSSQNSFEEFKLSMENKVKKIADQMTSIYSRRCNSQISNCQRKSYDYCYGTDEKACMEDFPTSQKCLNNQNGTYVSVTSGIGFPQSKEVQPLTQKAQVFVCASAFLDQSFKEIGNQRNNQFTFEFVGSAQGSMRVYPIFQQSNSNGQCIDFDPRTRPWYVAATSGSKNVILVIDTSGSMQQNNKINLAKEAAKSVINTLGNNDFFGIVEFSIYGKTLINSKLNRATISFKESMTKAIDELTADGGTIYYNAFLAAFRIFSNAKSDEFGSPCPDTENIILFLTDGQPTDNNFTVQDFIESVNRFQNQAGISSFRLFTYGFGLQQSEASQILSRLSCEYNGIAFQINSAGSSSELIQTMRQYYIFISEGVSITNPVWSEPYEDSFGFGRIITVAMPIYYTDQRTNIRTILGVAGIDVLISFFQKFQITNQSEIVRKLLTQLPCHQSSLTDCQLQNLRQFKCNIQNCSQAFIQSSQCEFINTRQIFATPVQTDGQICCFVKGEVIAGIVVGSVVGAILIGILIFCCCRRGCSSKKQQNQIQIQNKDSAQNIQQNPITQNSLAIDDKKYSNPYFA